MDETKENAVAGPEEKAELKKTVKQAEHVNAEEFMTELNSAQRDYQEKSYVRKKEVNLKLVFIKSTQAVPAVVPRYKTLERIKAPTPVSLSYKENKNKKAEIRQSKELFLNAMKEEGVSEEAITDYTGYILRQYRKNIEGNVEDVVDEIRDHSIKELTSLVFEPDMFKPEFFAEHFDYVLAQMKRYDRLAKEFCYDKQNPLSRYNELDLKGRAAADTFEKIYGQMQKCFETALRMHNIYFEKGYKNGFGKKKGALAVYGTKVNEKRKGERVSPADANYAAIQALKKAINENDIEIAYETEKEVGIYISEQKKEFEEKKDDFSMNYPLVKGVFMSRASFAEAQRFLAAFDDEKTADSYKKYEKQIKRVMADFIRYSELSHEWRLRDECYLKLREDLLKRYEDGKTFTPEAKKRFEQITRGLAGISYKRKLYSEYIENLKHLLEKAIFGEGEIGSQAEKLAFKYGFTRELFSKPKAKEDKGEAKKEESATVSTVQQQSETKEQAPAETQAQQQSEINEQASAEAEVKQQVIAGAAILNDIRKEKDELFRDSLESYLQLHGAKIKDFPKIVEILETEPFWMQMKPLTDTDKNPISDEEEQRELNEQEAMIELSILASMDKLDGLVENLNIRGCKIPGEKNKDLVTKAQTQIVDMFIRPRVREYTESKLPVTFDSDPEQILAAQPKLLELYSFGGMLVRLSTMPSEKEHINQRERLLGMKDLSGIKDPVRLEEEQLKQNTRYIPLVARFNEVKSLLYFCRALSLERAAALTDKPEELLTPGERRRFEEGVYGKGSFKEKMNEYKNKRIVEAVNLLMQSRRKISNDVHIQKWAKSVTEEKKKKLKQRQADRKLFDRMITRYEGIEKKYGHDIPDLSWIIVHFEEIKKELFYTESDLALVTSGTKLLKKKDKMDQRLIKLVEFYRVYDIIVTEKVPGLIADKEFDGHGNILVHPTLGELTQRFNKARAALEGAPIK